MSIEDPRLSMIDNTSAADEFDTAVEQHLGFAAETDDGIEVAQAETPDAGRTDRLPAQPPVEVAAAVIPGEVTPDADNVVTLPAGIELDNLEFRVDGANLVLVLTDGTEITVVGGAANIPTFVIGDVELPQVALFAVLEDNNINVAAGPDGTFSALASPEASRNFVDNAIDAGPEDFALADLLGDTNFGDEVNSASIFGGSGRPSIATPLTASFIYDEAVIAGGPGLKVISGVLPFNPGPDFGTITRIEFTGASNVDEGDGGSTVLAGFTSGGLPITVISNAAPADGDIKVFQAIEAFDSQGNPVFTLSVNRETGAFTFELIGKLEHPDAGANGEQDDLADLLRLGFSYTVTDLDGDSVTGFFNIDVMDDAPTFGAATPGTVDEDYLENGNIDGEGDVDDLPPSEEIGPLVSSGSTFATGSLGINWGADNGNNGGNAGLTGVAGDRGVAFTQATLNALNAKGLKSDGVTLQYALSSDGTTIVAYKPYVGEPELARIEAVAFEGPVREFPGIDVEFFGEPVFVVSVSDIAANGTYEFELLGNIDHADTTSEDELAIDFVFTAQDSDGDTASSSFTVTVKDDSPILNGDAKPIILTVDEDDIDTATSLGTAPNDGDQQDGSFTGTPGVNNGGPANATSTSGSLQSLVRAGADEQVSFSLISIDQARTYLESLGLNSNGLPLGFDIDAASGKIIGFVNSQAEGQAVPGQEYNAGPDRLVFEFEVTSDGTFKFSLYDQLDHKGTTVGLSEDKNSLTIDFGSVLEAKDGDGDRVPLNGLVKVNVTDDAPVLVPGATPITITVDEDDIDTATSRGNAPNDGNNPDGSFTGPAGSNTGGPANATSTGSLRSLVNVGADEAVTFSLISISEARLHLQNLGLTSKGLPLGFDLSANGTIIGFVNSQAPGQASPGQVYDEGDDRLVFQFQLNPNGTFTFSLFDQLDHAVPVPGTANENTLTIDFGAVLQASDNDGDSIGLSGLVKVNVTDDIPVIAANAQPITIVVDEDDIDTATSLGTAPNDGNGQDGSFTGTPGVDSRGPANATSTGSLYSLVSVGADENVSFSLISIAAARDYLQKLNLKSNGLPLGFDLSADGTIIGFVNSQAPGQASPGQVYDEGDDRLVFQFQLNPNGTFTFSLFDQLDHAPGQGQNTLSIDFGSVLQATDNDGDSVKLTGLVKVDVTDDMPELIAGAKVERTVDEDDILNDQSKGTSPADRDGDGSWTGGPDQNGEGGAFIDGSLAGLIKGGADDTVKFTFIDEALLRQKLTALNISSKGETLSYDVQGNVLWGFANVGGPGVSYDAADRPVFKLILNENGSYSFELLDQIDHDAPASGAEQNFGLRGSNADSVDFGAVIKVTDRDGDSITLDKAFTIEIRDDVPELIAGAKEERIVDEDDIRTSQSTGTSPNDSAADGSFTGSASNNQPGPAFISGSLAGLVKGGADEGYQFTFIDEGVLRQNLSALNISSKGETLSFDLQGNVLWGFANIGGPGVSYDQGDRPVFKLTLNENGSYTFELMDQLDHDAPVSGSDENFGLRGSNAEAIQFGDVIKITDRDGDSITLGQAFSIKIRDDVPELVAGKTEFRTVDEDDIDTDQATGTKPRDGNGDGSYTGGPGQNGVGPAFIEGSLSGLAKSGADEALSFTFASNTASVLQSLGLKSDGASLSYEVKGNVLFGFENKVGGSGFGEGDRVVFKLTLETDGDYTFELVDQLDHVKPSSGANENFALQPSVQSINFGAVINATDRDGDSISLDGVFSIRVRDDVPTVGTNPLIQLDDDALVGGIADGPGDDEEAAVLTGILAHEPGADGIASIVWAPNGIDVPFGFWFQLSADGKVMTITQKQGESENSYVPVFKAVITDSLTGAFEITQLAPVKHQGTIPGFEDNTAKIGFQYIVTDRDGDSVRGDVSFKIDDDTPTVGENALIKLDDGALPGGNPGGVGDDAETSPLKGILAHEGGADGTASVLWAPNGIDVPFGFWFELSEDGKTMTITQNQGVTEDNYVPIFKAVITDSLTGAYEITQLAPVKHGTSGTEDNVEISFQYRVTDGDGDVATGTLTVNVDDDTPVASHVTAEPLDDEGQSGGNPGSNLPSNFGDVAGELRQATGVTGTLFKAGADGLQSIAVQLPSFSVIYLDTLGFAKSEAAVWGDPSKGSDGSMTYTATSPNSVGNVAVLTINKDGSYTFDLNAPIAHGPGSALIEESKTLTFNFTVTDGDGDAANGSLTVVVNDDTPEPFLSVVSASEVLDDEGQSVFLANPDGKNDAEGELNFVSGGPGSLFNMGADGLRDLSVSLSPFGVIAKATSGFATIQIATWNGGVRSEGGVTTYTATAGGKAVAELVIRADGSYEFKLNAPLVHTSKGEREDDTDLLFTYSVTDGDGDKAYGALKITINDDTPKAVVEVRPEPLVQDSALGSADNIIKGGANALFTAGADGVQSVSITKPSFMVIREGADGFAVKEAAVWGDTGKTGPDGSTTFTATGAQSKDVVAVLTIKVDGSYSFELKAPLAHEANQDQSTIKIGFTVTDGDGDKSSGDLYLLVADDKPVAYHVTAQTLDDEGQSGGNPGSNLASDAGDVAGELRQASGVAGTLFKAGADGLQSIAVQLPIFSVIYLDTLGFAKSEAAVWGEPSKGSDGSMTYTATSLNSVGNVAVLTINKDGSYTFDLNAPIAHGPGSARIEENKTLTFNYTVTDGDGDTSNGSLKIVVNDDTPEPFLSVVSASEVLDDEGQSVFLANPDGKNDAEGELNVVSGGPGSLFNMGADGLRDLSVSLSPFGVIAKATSGFATIQIATWNGGVRSEGGVTTYTATAGGKAVAELVIRADGSYEFKLNAPLVHSSAGEKEDNTDLVFAYSVTDGDGDRVSGALKITINDDTPEAVVETRGSFGCAGTLFNAGADGVQSVSISGVPFKVGYDGKQGTTQENAQWSSSPLKGADGSTTFTAVGVLSKQVVAILVINVDGSYDFELKAPVKDPSATITFTVKDGDGDTASGKLILDLLGAVPSRVEFAAKAVDPIVLDLDHDGFELSSIGSGVMFDVNADGHKDLTGWTSKDGILALDLDGNGVIDNGSEIFTPDFNGGKFASGVAALASLDTNGDGKIDASDAAFDDLKIWVDANNNGISDEGELSSLFDNGVTGISLTTDNTGGREDGQTVFSKGTFTFADGSTGDFMEVGFDTIFGSDADPLTVMGTDGDDILHGGMGQVIMTGGAGADTFVFDATALSELDVADVITDFNSDEGDVLDVTALLDSLLGEQASAETAASHLRATVEDGNTTVSVQTDTDTWKDVVVLQNHDTAIKVLFDDKHTVVTPHD